MTDQPDQPDQPDTGGGQRTYSSPEELAQILTEMDWAEATVTGEIDGRTVDVFRALVCPLCGSLVPPTEDDSDGPLHLHIGYHASMFEQFQRAMGWVQNL